MPMADNTASTKRSGSRTGREAARAASKPVDAIKLLKDDHRDVKNWFREFEDLEDGRQKAALARKICEALKVHAAVEEEIFYPALKAKIDDADLLDEAEVEHASAKQLISEIEAMKASDRLFDAKVKVLGEYVMHHVQEEENEIFTEARESGLDLVELGRRLAERKAELG